MRHAVAVVLALVVSSCALPALTPAGQTVRVVETMPEGCDFIRTVSHSLGANFHDLDDNIVAAEAVVRNEAADAGATHLVLAAPEQQDRSRWAGDGCNNCALVTGRAYRCSEGQR